MSRRQQLFHLALLKIEPFQSRALWLTMWSQDQNDLLHQLQSDRIYFPMICNNISLSV